MLPYFQLENTKKRNTILPQFCAWIDARRENFVTVFTALHFCLLDKLCNLRRLNMDTFYFSLPLVKTETKTIESERNAVFNNLHLSGHTKGFLQRKIIKLKRVRHMSRGFNERMKLWLWFHLVDDKDLSRFWSFPIIMKLEGNVTRVLLLLTMSVFAGNFPLIYGPKLLHWMYEGYIFQRSPNQSNVTEFMFNLSNAIRISMLAIINYSTSESFSVIFPSLLQKTKLQ